MIPDGVELCSRSLLALRLRLKNGLIDWLIPSPSTKRSLGSTSDLALADRWRQCTKSERVFGIVWGTRERQLERTTKLIHSVSETWRELEERQNTLHTLYGIQVTILPPNGDHKKNLNLANWSVGSSWFKAYFNQYISQIEWLAGGRRQSRERLIKTGRLWSDSLCTRENERETKPRAAPDNWPAFVFVCLFVLNLKIISPVMTRVTRSLAAQTCSEIRKVQQFEIEWFRFKQQYKFYFRN